MCKYLGIAIEWLFEKVLFPLIKFIFEVLGKTVLMMCETAKFLWEKVLVPVTTFLW